TPRLGGGRGAEPPPRFRGRPFALLAAESEVQRLRQPYVEIVAGSYPEIAYPTREIAAREMFSHNPLIFSLYRMPPPRVLIGKAGPSLRPESGPPVFPPAGGAA